MNGEDTVTAIVDKAAEGNRGINLRDYQVRALSRALHRSDHKMASLKAERDGLREALEPFAKAAEWDWSTTIFKTPESAVLCNADGERVTLQQFYAARQALKGVGGE